MKCWAKCSWYNVMYFVRQLLILAWTMGTSSQKLFCDIRDGICESNLMNIELSKLLVDDIHMPPQRFLITCTSRNWFYSSNETFHNAIPVNSSSFTYQTSENDLNISFSNVSGSNEGIYGCVDTATNSHRVVLCIYVYGRATFASCQYTVNGTCWDEVFVNETPDGGNASFNATVIYTAGGGCNLRQDVTHIKLHRIQNGTSRWLLVYNNMINYKRVTAKREGVRVRVTNRTSGFEFILMLSSADSANMTGLYEVTIETKDPSTGSFSSIKKGFLLSSPTRTTESATTASQATPTTTLHKVTDQPTTVTDDNSNQVDVSPSIPVHALYIVVATIMLVILIFGGVVSVKVMLSCKVSKAKSNRITSILPCPNDSHNFDESSNHCDRELTLEGGTVPVEEPRQSDIEPYTAPLELPPPTETSSGIDVDIYLPSNGNSHHVHVELFD